MLSSTGRVGLYNFNSAILDLQASHTIVILEKLYFIEIIEKTIEHKETGIVFVHVENCDQDQIKGGYCIPELIH